METYKGVDDTVARVSRQTKTVDSGSETLTFNDIKFLTKLGYKVLNKADVLRRCKNGKRGHRRR